MAKEFMQGGGVSTRQSVYADQELMDSVPYFKPLVDSMPFVNPIHRPRFPEYPAMSEEMAINASRAFIGEITPEEALKNIDEKIFKILDEAGYYSGKKNLYQ
jgi:multiple sugar transport system substrate-binding protein